MVLYYLVLEQDSLQLCAYCILEKTGLTLTTTVENPGVQEEQTWFTDLKSRVLVIFRKVVYNKGLRMTIFWKMILNDAESYMPKQKMVMNVKNYKNKSRGKSYSCCGQKNSPLQSTGPQPDRKQIIVWYILDVYG